MFFDCEHRMIRRLLALWLLVSLVGYGSLWAMDLHGAGVADHHSGQQSAGIADGDSRVGDGASMELTADQALESACASACDHCCHGMSHLIGLFGSGLSTAYSPDTRAADPPSVPLISRALSPDLRPSIA